MCPLASSIVCRNEPGPLSSALVTVKTSTTGLMVIETLEHAEARGAQPLAQLSGYGTSADAHHITSGPEDGAGAAAAVRAALRMAGLEPQQIGYVHPVTFPPHCGVTRSRAVGPMVEVPGLAQGCQMAP